MGDYASPGHYYRALLKARREELEQVKAELEALKSRWVYISSCGDGSVSLRVFSSKEKAERYKSYETEPFGDDEVFQFGDEEIDPINWMDPEHPANLMEARYWQEVKKADGAYGVAYSSSLPALVRKAKVVVGYGGVLTKNAFGPLA